MIILLVLKNKSVMEFVSGNLKVAGHQIRYAYNSNEAVVVLKSYQVDLVITEVDIGKVDGWRLARLIRSGILASSDELPILLITENHCERIAETTAKIFDINRVISYQELALVNDVVVQLSTKQGNLNNKGSILVIEDTPDTAALIQRMLKHNFDVDIAPDGFSGITALKKRPYDIVLLDIMMPGMSGDEVLDVIVETNPKQVVIAMTAHGTVDLAELMLVKGAADYIQKPFRAEQLRKVCDIASKREDFIVSNEQFAAKTMALQSEQKKFNSLSKSHYRVLDCISSIVIEIAPSGRISFVNNAWFRSTGFMVSATIGKLFIDFIHELGYKSKSYIEESISDLLLGKITKDNIELKLIHKSNDFFWGELNLTPYLNDAGEIIGISGTIDDISVRKKAEQQLKHVALHDTLTGIHNRYYFDNELTNIANSAARTGIHHSLLYLDLDHFKIINDSQGHHQGDLVLKEIARLLSERTRASDILCRIGGDEFAMLLTNTSIEDAKKFALEICQTIANSCFQFDDKVFKVSSSIGISAIDGKAYSCDIYLQQADIAMYAAKQSGRNRVHIYRDDDKVTEELKQGFEWAQKLQAALFADDIVLHFQPVIDVKTRNIVYYEALVRLVVDNKMIFPGEFIPSLEKAEDISLLDRHVIGKALSIMKSHPVLTKVAINLSAQAFADDRLYLYIQEKLAEYSICPSRIIFELTETASLSNITGTQRLVNQLNELGCSFSIDDFGTGFSTFSYLKQIPAASVKIDGSFVRDMLTDATDAILVKSIHETALALNKKTVAEFVEDEATLIHLAELGVHYAQGFYISKPMDITDLYEKDEEPNSAA